MCAYRLGLVSVSFRAHTPEEILQAMKETKLDYIEWGGDVHAPSNEPEKIRHIATLQKDYGVCCSSYGSYFRIGVSPLSDLEPICTAAQTLGTNIIRLWAGNEGSAAYTAEKKNAFFSVCREIAEIGKKQEVIFCMECHNWTFTDTKETALELMKAVHSPHFKMYWQPNQFKSEEENIAYAKLLAQYTEHIHVFNWKGEQKNPLCEAVDVWKKYLAAFDTNKTLLLEFMPDGNITSLATEADALRKIAEE